MKRLVLPVPPSLNKIYAHSRFGVRLSQAANDFKSAVFYDYRELVRKGDVDDTPYGKDVVVFIVVYRKRNSGDSDNFTKILFDSLNGLVWVDDKQVDKYTVQRGPIDCDWPRLEMWVWDRKKEKKPADVIELERLYETE